MQQVFKAALIGLGNIGMMYDYQNNHTEKNISLANSVVNNPNYILSCGIDPCNTQQHLFQKKFNIPTFSTIEDLFKKQSPDIFIIATPTSYHYTNFIEITNKNTTIKGIICEKPLAYDLYQAEDMAKICEEKNIPCAVNYTRRYEPQHIQLKNRIHTQEFGKLISGIVFYSKGLFNNGTHFIDLLNFFFDSPPKIQTVTANKRCLGEDIEPEFTLEFGENAFVTFKPLPFETHPTNELHLFFEKGILRYLQGGRTVYFENAKNTAPERLKTDFLFYQKYIFEALHNKIIDNSFRLNSDIHSALNTLKIATEIKRSLKK